MSDYVNIHAMDEAIAEFKQMKREETELKLLDMFSQIVAEYKKYNSDGKYLVMTLGEDGSLSVNNQYFEEDNEHPIDAIIYGTEFGEDCGKFQSRTQRLGGNEDE